MPGRSPTTITFVTRKSCSLCDEALQTLRLAAKPPLVEITMIDVDSDRDLLKRFGNRVPVVLSQTAGCSPRGEYRSVKRGALYKRCDPRSSRCHDGLLAATREPAADLDSSGALYPRLSD